MATEVNLEDMSVKELREIARAVGINYLGERKKAELIDCIRHAEKVRNFQVPEGKRVAGYFLDGMPILEDEQ